MWSGLPVGVAAFVGRERERAQVADLVAGVRVVTLIGPGGCGKTWLAVEVVGDVASRLSDGACWVDLQGVNEPGLVAPAIGAAVDVHERPEQALIDTLVEQLHGRHLLVVLDNCAHLVEAGSRRRFEVAAHCRCPPPMLSPPERSRQRTRRGCSRWGLAGGRGLSDRCRQRLGGGRDLPASGWDPVGDRAGGGAGAGAGAGPDRSRVVGPVRVVDRRGAGGAGTSANAVRR